MVSKWPVQGLSIEGAAGARPAGPCALGSAEMDVSAEFVALFALAFHPLDATTVSHALPLFRARTEDGH